MSSGQNVFETLGSDFTLLAFNGGDAAETAFATAAQALGVPLNIVRDSYEQGRHAYEAKFILVRPDRYIAWTADSLPDDAAAIVAKAAGRT
jgi:hypothetical protein